MKSLARLSCLLLYVVSQSVGSDAPMRCHSFRNCQYEFTRAAEAHHCSEMRNALRCMYAAWDDCAQENRQPVTYDYLSARATTVESMCDSAQVRKDDAVMMASQASLRSAPILLLIVFYSVLAMLWFR